MTKVYPFEAGEAEEFIPASLRDVPNAPKFWLRWGTPREKERHRRVMDEEGAVIYTEALMREELLRGMEALLGDDYSTWDGKIRSWWEARDAYAKEFEGVPPEDRPEFRHDDEAMIVEVQEQVVRDWRPYRLMEADNKAYQRTLAPAIASVIVERFEGLESAPVKRVGQYLSFDCARYMLDRLDAWAWANGVSRDKRPSIELNAACLTRLFLDKEALGNFESPAPSEPIPDTSSSGKGAKSGTSKGSGRSKKTRARASTTPSGT